MTDKPYVEKLGGSYVVDPKTGAEKRVAGTAEPKGALIREQPAAPAAAEPVSSEPDAKKGK
ncbi:MAG: hypothetical protein ABIF45_17395 [Pseudomonadota bacterium]